MTKPEELKDTRTAAEIRDDLIRNEARLQNLVEEIRAYPSYQTPLYTIKPDAFIAIDDRTVVRFSELVAAWNQREGER